MLARAFIIAVAFAASPAYADWQYTRWGMGVGEIQAAAGAELLSDWDFSRYSTDRSETRAATIYTAGDREYIAMFGFDGSGLNTVTLHPRESHQCQEIFHDLRPVYGEPIPAPRIRLTHLSRWRDEGAGNEIYFLAIGGLRAAECTIEYRPLLTRDETGL